MAPTSTAPVSKDPSPETSSESTGELYVVATPIGNLGDLSPRAIEILKTSNLILAEDTRTFSRLSSRFGISTHCLSYHEHNEKRRAEEMVQRIEAGERVALTSDAGTPTLSDPGFRLVSAARKRNLTVRSIPGPCAAIAALSISGLPTNRFLFDGFLPPKPGKRRKRLLELLRLDCTSVVYESPHRLLKTLAEIERLDGDRILFLGRELTKLHEEGLLLPAREMLTLLGKRQSIKGECVLLLSPRDEDSAELPESTGGFDESEDVNEDSAILPSDEEVQ